MITQYEVPSLLKEELPTITSDNFPARLNMDVYKSMQCFSDYTKTAVLDHNFHLAKKCFSLAGKLYRQGDHMVKNVIENTFVFSFTSFMPNDRVEKLILQSMIPAVLYAVYIKQVMGSGC
ncbi:DUF7674 family protein [Paraflavitalea speifideaquila]|uniref:DUF7674 family protein n=1 Tax=Paraflavitalea speifideaquila TaxID=3076558 RepID=UPI0028E5FE06|nr:hypothetical protein [Paraflavitalea speifideiaquila]